MPQTYRCQNCELLWPPILEYNRCPKCGRGLYSVHSVKEPMRPDEAHNLSLHFKFEKYLEDHVEIEDCLDPELEERLERHINEVNRRHLNSINGIKDPFEASLENQFDPDALARIKQIEGVMKGRAEYNSYGPNQPYLTDD